MSNSEIDRLHAESLNLSHEDRVELVRKLVASLDSVENYETTESRFQKRMRIHSSHVWELASRTLTVAQP